MENKIIDILRQRVPVRISGTKSRDERSFLLASAGIIPRFVVLNPAAKEIYRLCDGQNNIEKIIKTILEKHAGEDVDRIARDVVMGVRDLEAAALITLSGGQHQK